MVFLFDTLKLAQRFEAAGLPPSQAQAMAAALAETISADLVTRDYLDSALQRTKNKILRWSFGETLAILGVVAALHFLH